MKTIIMSVFVIALSFIYNAKLPVGKLYAIEKSIPTDDGGPVKPPPKNGGKKSV